MFNRTQYAQTAVSENLNFFNFIYEMELTRTYKHTFFALRRHPLKSIAGKLLSSPERNPLSVDRRARFSNGIRASGIRDSREN